VTLGRNLAVLRAVSVRRAAPGRVSLLEGGIGALRRSGLLDTALGAGQLAPGFELPDEDGELISLAALLARGPAVVTFFRGGWCPYCSLQLQAYEAMLPALAAFGAELVAVSPQKPELSRTVVAQHDLRFPVLSDAGSLVARRYGVVYQLSPALQDVHARSGVVLPDINGDADWQLPVPATFVVEPSGRVALSYVDVDYRNRLEPAEILAALRSLPPAGLSPQHVLQELMPS
jgi:peroxiredoxin